MTLRSRAPRTLRDESAASMVEYALLLAVVALVAMIAVRALGNATSSSFGEVARAVCSDGNGNGNHGNGQGNCGGDGSNGHGSGS